MNPTPQVKSLSLILPAYNESRRIQTNLRTLVQYLDALPHSYELIVVDDGSTDGTAAPAREALAGRKEGRVIEYRPNRGKGYALRTGILASTGRWVVFTDADLSTSLDEIPRALARLEHADVVVGSRALPESRVAVRAPFYRRLATGIFDLVKHLLVGLWEIRDTQCGFKAYRGDVARALYSQSRVDRFMFDVEILFLAKRAGLRVEEMPVTWQASDETKVRFFAGIYQMLRDLVRIRWWHRT